MPFNDIWVPAPPGDISVAPQKPHRWNPPAFSQNLPFSRPLVPGAHPGDTPISQAFLVRSVGSSLFSFFPGLLLVPSWYPWISRHLELRTSHRAEW